MLLAESEDILFAITHLVNCVVAGRKLLDQVRKFMERLLKTIIRTHVNIDSM